MFFGFDKARNTIILARGIQGQALAWLVWERTSDGEELGDKNKNKIIYQACQSLLVSPAFST
jgi:hypothetical protein